MIALTVSIINKRQRERALILRVFLPIFGQTLRIHEPYENSVKIVAKLKIPINSRSRC